MSFSSKQPSAEWKKKESAGMRRTDLKQGHQSTQQSLTLRQHTSCNRRSLQKELPSDQSWNLNQYHTTLYLLPLSNAER
jgi:hypothetical protein